MNCTGALPMKPRIFRHISIASRAQRAAFAIAADASSTFGSSRDSQRNDASAAALAADSG
ncbi:hypothetical protein AK34_1828 [Burkholderia dolosa AU0158]|nr:hypothetical protein AK34_1828 [Burkholderia dolosa AU0158]VWB76684.1 hypothetical protein BDO18943_03608 [Burkholderia dolosa]